MSEPVIEPVVETDDVFGSSFEEALAAAYADAGLTTDIEVKPTPDKPEPEVIKPAPAKPEPEAVKPDPKADPLDDIEEEEEHDVALPLDEDVPEPEEPEDTTGMTKSASERFKQLRTETKAVKLELATAKQEAALAAARVKELEAVTGSAEELQKKLESYEMKLAVSDIRETEAYKAAVASPLADIARTATEIAKKHSINADKLIDAIAIEDTAEQDEAFDELLSGVNDRDKLKIFSLAEKLPAIMAEEAKLQSNSKEVLAELSARAEADKQKAALEAAAARKVAVDLVAERVAKKLPFLTGSDKFDLAAVKAKIADVDFDALDPTTKAYNAYSGHLVPQMAKAITAFYKELETVTDELSKYKKSSPSLKGGAAPVAGNHDAELSFEEAVERALAGT